MQTHTKVVSSGSLNWVFTSSITACTYVKILACSHLHCIQTLRAELNEKPEKSCIAVFLAS